MTPRELEIERLTKETKRLYANWRHHHHIADEYYCRWTAAKKELLARQAEPTQQEPR